MAFLFYVALLAALLALWRALWRPRKLTGLGRTPPLAIGHRGVRGPRPENTLAAVGYALDAGLDGAEVDVQRLADGALVLFHDADTAGQPLLTLNLPELRALHPDVPKLEELFDLMRGYPGTLLNIELKAQTWATNGLERAVAAQVLASGLEERSLISSFSPLSLLRLRLYAPSLRVGLLYAPGLPWWGRSGRLAAWLHVDALHPHESLVTPAFMAKAAAKNLMVNVWTVNDEKRITSLRGLGVTAIIGDNPVTFGRP